MKRNMTRVSLITISIAAIFSAIAVPAVAQSFPGVGTVMTYNVRCLPKSKAPILRSGCGLWLEKSSRHSRNW